MQTILFKVLVAGGLAAFALVIGIVLRRQFVDLHEFVCRTPKWQRLFLGVFLVVFISFGGSKNDATNNGEEVSLPLVTNLTSAVFLNGPRSSFLTSGEDAASPLFAASPLCAASPFWDSPIFSSARSNSTERTPSSRSSSSAASSPSRTYSKTLSATTNS